jgi:V/A-type H+/Na+-transporting ATPase subunit C
MSYEYANARLRAMKGRLFDRRMYGELAALTRFDDVIARLAQSTYADEIQGALARYVGTRVVMEACRLHLANTLRKIRSFFDVDGARLASVLLARWDLLNLKTILRGHEAGVSPEVILEALVPAGDLDESALRTLARQADPLATADLLRTWNFSYAQAVRRALDTLSEKHDWSAFERALDAIFYAQLMASLNKDKPNDELVRELLAHEMDGANVVTALRLRHDLVTPSSPAGAWGEAQTDVAQHFLHGGGLPHEWLLSLVSAARDEEALALLRASKFGASIEGLESLDLAKIQRALDHDLARFGIAFFARDPLSIATAIGYVVGKSAEAANVRFIAQGVVLNMKPEEIEKELII